MKKKIIKWIERLFGIDEIKKNLEEKANELTNTNQHFQRKYAQLQEKTNSAALFEAEYKSKVKDLQELMSILNKSKIGMDVAFGPHSRSWAIVCLGKTKEAVHFYQFPDADMRDLDLFLKNFTRSVGSGRKNQIVDYPFGSEIFFK